MKKNRLDYNKRIQVIPVGGYENTLELHQIFLQEEVFKPASHIISIIDGDVEKTIANKRLNDGKWAYIPYDSILFLPIESLEKHLKSELFDKKNYALMRLIRDRLFKFETEINWFFKPYKDNIENKKQDDIKKAKLYRMTLNISKMEKIYLQFYRKNMITKEVALQISAKKLAKL